MNLQNVNQPRSVLECFYHKLASFMAMIAIIAFMMMGLIVQPSAQDRNQPFAQDVINPSAQDQITPSTQDDQAAVQNGSISEIKQDWRKTVGTFRIGMIRNTSTNPDPKLIEQVEQLFSDALNMPARIALFSNFSTLIDAQATGRILYGVYSAQAYATLQVLCNCVMPLVAPRLSSGETGIVAVLAANQQRMPNMLDMSDRKIAWPEDQNATSIMLATESLRVLGAPIEQDAPFIVSVSGQNAMVGALLADAVDGALLTLNALPDDEDVVLLERIEQQFPLKAEQAETDQLETEQAVIAQNIPALALLWKSGFLRFGPHVLSLSVPEEARKIVMDMTASIDDAENPILTLFNEGFGGGYQTVQKQDYQPAINFVSGLKTR